MRQWLKTLLRRAASSATADLERRLEALDGQLRREQRRVDTLTQVLEAAAGDPTMLWLFANRQERMDANVAFFEKTRRDFHLARYHFACDFARGLDVADIASGTGYGSRLLRETGGARTVTGIERDPQAASYARAHYAGAEVAFLEASAEATGLADGSVDLIVSFETIEHVPDEQALMREWIRILRPGGRLILTTPNQWEPDDNEHHVRNYNRRSLEQTLLPHFQKLKFYDQNSGSGSLNNRGQSAGIRESIDADSSRAECLLVVCRRA